MSYIFNVSDMDTVLCELNGLRVHIENNTIVDVSPIADRLGTDYNFVTMMAERGGVTNLLLIEDSDPIFSMDSVKEARYALM